MTNHEQPSDTARAVDKDVVVWGDSRNVANLLSWAASINESRSQASTHITMAPIPHRVVDQRGSISVQSATLNVEY